MLIFLFMIVSLWTFQMLLREISMGCVLTGYVLNLVLVLSFLMLSSFHPKNTKKQNKQACIQKKKKKEAQVNVILYKYLLFLFWNFGRNNTFPITLFDIYLFIFLQNIIKFRKGQRDGCKVLFQLRPAFLKEKKNGVSTQTFFWKSFFIQTVLCCSISPVISQRKT